MKKYFVTLFLLYVCASVVNAGTPPEISLSPVAYRQPVREAVAVGGFITDDVGNVSSDNIIEANLYWRRTGDFSYQVVPMKYQFQNYFQGIIDAEYIGEGEYEYYIEVKDNEGYTSRIGGADNPKRFRGGVFRNERAGGDIGSGYGLLSIPDADRYRIETLQGWPKQTGAQIGSSPNIADFDGDGKMEVAIGSDDGKIYVYRADGTFYPGWPTAPHDGYPAIPKFRSTPAIGDITNDGKPDIVVGITQKRPVYRWRKNLYAFNSDGSIVSGWPVRQWGFEFWEASPSLDGSNIYMSSWWGGRITAYKQEATGITTMWRKVGGQNSSTSYGNGNVYAGVCWKRVFGIKKDTGEYFGGWPDSTYGQMHLSDGQTQLSGRVFRSSPVLGDVTGDGHINVVAVANGTDVPLVLSNLYVFTEDGYLLSGYPVELTSNKIFTSPALADFNNDGAAEIVTAAYDGTVTVFDGSGNPLPGWPVHLDENIEGASPIIADIDGDLDPEIIVATAPDDNSSAHLYAFHSDGTKVINWPIELPMPVESTPAVSDLDGDGDIDLVVGCNDGKVYAFDLPGPYKPAGMHWPMYQHDPVHTGHYTYPSDDENELSVSILPPDPYSDEDLRSVYRMKNDDGRTDNIVYEWSKDGKTENDLRRSTVPFSRTRVNDVWKLTIKKYLSGGRILTASDEVKILNTPPIAEAGPDKTVITDRNVTFDGSLSADSDDNITAYTWGFGDGSLPLSRLTPAIDYKYTTPGTYTVTLYVRDAEGAQDSDTLIVGVFPPPDIHYEIELTKDITSHHDGNEVSVDDVIKYKLSLANKSDTGLTDIVLTDVLPDGLKLNDESLQASNIQSLSDGRTSITWNIDKLGYEDKKEINYEAKAKLYQHSGGIIENGTILQNFASVESNEAASDTAEASLVFQLRNEPPEIVWQPSEIEVCAGETLDIRNHLTVSDPDGDNVTITFEGWKSDIWNYSHTYTPTLNDLNNGAPYSVLVRADDGKTGVTERTVSIRIKDCRPPNKLPVITREDTLIVLCPGYNLNLPVEIGHIYDPDGETVAVAYDGWHADDWNNNRSYVITMDDVVLNDEEESHNDNSSYNDNSSSSSNSNDNSSSSSNSNDNSSSSGNSNDNSSSSSNSNDNSSSSSNSNDNSSSSSNSNDNSSYNDNSSANDNSNDNSSSSSNSNDNSSYNDNSSASSNSNDNSSYNDNSSSSSNSNDNSSGGEEGEEDFGSHHVKVTASDARGGVTIKHYYIQVRTDGICAPPKPEPELKLHAQSEGTAPVVVITLENNGEEEKDVAEDIELTVKIIHGGEMVESIELNKKIPSLKHKKKKEITCRIHTKPLWRFLGGNAEIKIEITVTKEKHNRDNIGKKITYTYKKQLTPVEKEKLKHVKELRVFNNLKKKQKIKVKLEKKKKIRMEMFNSTGEAASIEFDGGTLLSDTDNLIAEISDTEAHEEALGADDAPDVAGDLIEIHLESGQHEFDDTQSVTIEIPYTDDDDDQRIEINGQETNYTVSSLSLFSYAGSGWEEIDSEINEKEKKVKGNVSHFTLFTIGVNASARLRQTATTLDEVTVYPNPFRPNDADPATGQEYREGDITTGVLIGRLTNNVRIEIFNIRGERIDRFDVQNNGTVQWDGKNNRGKTVASGTYFILIKDVDSGATTVKKLAVIR